MKDVRDMTAAEIQAELEALGMPFPIVGGDHTDDTDDTGGNRKKPKVVNRSRASDTYDDAIHDDDDGDDADDESEDDESDDDSDDSEDDSDDDSDDEESGERLYTAEDVARIAASRARRARKAERRRLRREGGSDTSGTNAGGSQNRNSQNADDDAGDDDTKIPAWAKPLLDRITEADRTQKQNQINALKIEIGKKYGLNETAALRIQGETREDIEDDAEEFAASLRVIRKKAPNTESGRGRKTSTNSKRKPAHTYIDKSNIVPFPD